MTSARDQQVRALYRAALERPLGERESFVADLAGGDDELRQSVQLMLSRHGATDVDAEQSAPLDPAKEHAPGTQVGSYRIDGVLGRGGMGVVYRATDTKLRRPVAIKFLVVAIADAGAKRRFRQEADTASGLNHPHIVTVYDVGEHDAAQYIVSELVDGGTLDDGSAAMRRRGWRQSVELLTGVADGVAAAHAAGVLHRDIKPGNILIGSNGYAKLADFGLAKLVDKGESPAPVSHPTRAGMVIGTVAYMSPEQAAGLELDARSDIFSFGVVLYELLTGRRPFDGANDLETLKSIAHAAPAPLPDDMPEPLRAAVEKSLEKDPAERYQDMRELVIDLRRVTRKSASSQAAALAAGSPRRARLPWLLLAGCGAVLTAALVPAALYFLRAPVAAAPRLHFAFAAPGYLDASLGGGNLAISPNGRLIAYVAVADGVQQVWIRPSDALEARALPGTEGAERLFWAPDSRSLAFRVEGQFIKKIDLAGGLPQTVVSATTDLGPGSWGRDGTILYPGIGSGRTASSFIGRVPQTGGTLTPLTERNWTDDEPLHVLPKMLRDSDHFLYMSLNPGSGRGTLHRHSLEGDDDVELATGFDGTANGIVYTPGFLLYIQGTTLLARRFDLDAVELRGEPVLVAENVAEASAADAGVLVYVEGAGSTTAAPARTQRLVWRDRRGERIGEVDVPADFTFPALSPDGGRIAVSVPTRGNEDIWMIDAGRGVTTRLTFHPSVDRFSSWSPDGERILFGSNRVSIAPFTNELYMRPANGSGTDTQLLTIPPSELLTPLGWSPDGSVILFGRTPLADLATRVDIWMLPTSPGSTPVPLLESPFLKGPVAFSPDGRFIAYATNESGESQVIVQPFPDVSRGKWQVSARGGYQPRWRGDGRELFYLAPDGNLTAVDVAPGDAFEAGRPRVLFATTIPPRAILATRTIDVLYNVTADGERFLITEPAESQATDAGSPPPARQIHVIANWATDLDEK